MAIIMQRQQKCEWLEHSLAPHKDNKARDMDIYLVGGAVRDQLLKRSVHEKDWVVVGAHPEQLLSEGYRQVGKDFPVFLHPKNHEEYALARTERKTGPGYTGFTCHAAPDVSLEDDLKRRDLTLNAMAMDQDGSITDPFGGQKDITAKQLRHVSAAFSEDPVRVIRVARFAAQLPDFTVHPDTMALMQDMVKAGETKHLTPERLWKECDKAMHAQAPWRFFEVLKETGLLTELIGGLKISWETLKKASKISDDATIRFACTWHLGSIEAVTMLCKAWRLPKRYAALAILLTAHLKDLQKPPTAKGALATLQQCDAFRRPERFMDLLTAARACTTKARHDIERFWQQALVSCEKVDMSAIEEAPNDQSIKLTVQRARVKQLSDFLKTYKE